MLVRFSPSPITVDLWAEKGTVRYISSDFFFPSGSYSVKKKVKIVYLTSESTPHMFFPSHNLLPTCTYSWPNPIIGPERALPALNSIETFARAFDSISIVHKDPADFKQVFLSTGRCHTRS